MPPVIRDTAAIYFRNKIKKQIYEHSIGRHNADEIFKLDILDIDSLSSSQAKKYFLGEQPTTLDASAFGVLISTLGCPIESPLKDYCLLKVNLTNFIARIKKLYYPDLKIIICSRLKYTLKKKVKIQYADTIELTTMPSFYIKYELLGL